MIHLVAFSPADRQGPAEIGSRRVSSSDEAGAPACEVMHVDRAVLGGAGRRDAHGVRTVVSKAGRQVHGGGRGHPYRRRRFTPPNGVAVRQMGRQNG